MKFLLKLAKFVAKFVIFLLALSACVRLYACLEFRSRQTCAVRYQRSQEMKKTDRDKATAINKERCQHPRTGLAACNDRFCRKQELGEYA